MEVLPVDILMFEDNVGLIPISHTLHVFLRDVPKLIVGQSVFGRGVQRGMENRVRSPAVGFEIRHEALHAGVNIKASAFIVWFEHLLPEKHLGFIFIDLFLVVT